MQADVVYSKPHKVKGYADDLTIILSIPAELQEKGVRLLLDVAGRTPTNTDGKILLGFLPIKVQRVAFIGYTNRHLCTYHLHGTLHLVPMWVIMT